MEAPGTYHHSLVVANLSEAAAEGIGANAAMCRVCAYFHDIGKLAKPEYFIENMDPADNPHDDLTARMSAPYPHRPCEGRRGPRHQAQAELQHH